MSEIQDAKWYVVHTYSGHENKVKATIENTVKNRGMEDYIKQVIVPTEDVIETTKTGKEKVESKVCINSPYGYIYNNLIYFDGSNGWTSSSAILKHDGTSIKLCNLPVCTYNNLHYIWLGHYKKWLQKFDTQDSEHGYISNGWSVSKLYL